MRTFTLALLLAAVLLSSGCAGETATESTTGGTSEVANAEPVVAAAYLAEVEAWQRERDERLADPEGWLTLAGLSWFVPGENIAGSDLAYDIPLPESVPAKLGVFHFRPDGPEGEKVELVIDEAVTADVMVADEPVTRTAMRLDVEGDPTIVEIGSVSFFAIQRGEQVGLRVRDRDSAALRDFTGVPRYAVDPSWRLPARFEPHDPPKSIQVPTVLGTSFDSPSPGRLSFDHGGETYVVDALPAGNNALWVIFSDATNADTTYGSGRFLDVELPAGIEAGASDTVIDFNLAYNPPCAFTPYATCPLPPEENALTLRVEAGEKRFSDHAH